MLRLLKAFQMNSGPSEEAVYKEMTAYAGETLASQGFEKVRQEILSLYSGNARNKSTLAKRLDALEKIRARMEE